MSKGAPLLALLGFLVLPLVWSVPEALVTAGAARCGCSCCRCCCRPAAVSLQAGRMLQTEADVVCCIACCACRSNVSAQACASCPCVAELATTFPENSGYVAWVTAAFGPFWGFQVRSAAAAAALLLLRMQQDAPPIGKWHACSFSMARVRQVGLPQRPR